MAGDEVSEGVEGEEGKLWELGEECCMSVVEGGMVGQGGGELA